MGSSINSIYSTVNFALGIHNRALARLQEQAMGQRINRSSDDPSDAYRVLGLSAQRRVNTSNLSAIAEINDFLGISSIVVQQMNEKLAGVRAELASTSGTDGNRNILIQSIDSTLEQLLSLANTRHSGSYLFGGTDSDSAPYVASYTNGQISSVSYEGSDLTREVQVVEGVSTSGLSVGSDVFGLNERATPTIFGQTGAAIASGTSSTKGFTWLDITEPVAGTYRLSVDDGASHVDVAVPPGNANTKVTNSITGEVLYVDTTAITATGQNVICNTGAMDVFDLLIGMRDIYANTHNVPSDQLEVLLISMRSEFIEKVEEVNAVLIRTNVSLGSKINFLDGLKNTVSEIDHNAEDETSRLTDTDIAEISVELSRREVLYQMSMAVAGKMMSVTLLDFVR